MERCSGRGRYFSDMVIPFLDADPYFYCFLHEPGGDNYGV